MVGYIKLFRQIQESDSYFDGKFDKTHAWIDLILLANFRDGFIVKRGIRIEVKRGQIAKSVDFFCDRWKWSHPTVEKFFKELEVCEQICVQRSRVTNLISIVNYERFQSDDENCCEQNCEQTCEQNKKGSPCTPSKEKTKEGKEEKKSSYSNEYSDEEKNSELFQEFERFSDWIKKQCEQIAKMKTQLTFAEYSKIRASHSKEELVYVCTKMDNWTKLSKECSNVYRTLLDRFTRYHDDMVREGIIKNERNGKAADIKF